ARTYTSGYLHPHPVHTQKLATRTANRRIPPRRRRLRRPGLRLELPRTRRPLLVWAAGGSCLALVGCAALLAWPASSLLTPDHAHGNRSWSWIYLGLIVAAFVLYLGALALIARGWVAGTGGILAVAAAIQL